MNSEGNIDMMKHKHEGLYKNYFKRLLDFVLSGLALIVLSPLILIVALLVRTKLGSPIFFKQARPGKGEKIFYLYKFRSMTNVVDKNGKLLSDSERLTKFGKFLRKSSIDEIPELINILKGDMSIVGPRPLSIYYLPHYDDVTKKRHDVRPGLTGLAQVNGRNNLPWDERFELDLKYVNDLTFLNDVKIILKTLFKVIKAEDILVRGTTKIYDFGTYKRIQEESGTTGMNAYDTTYSEIGSYFWLDKENIFISKGNITFLPKVKDSTFTFSGRTAIEIALRDALKYKHIRKAYVPSYCCVSMLQSFIDNGIKFDFYEVKLENGEIKYEIDANKDCDLILYMKYFGIDSNDISGNFSKMKEKGTIIVEDITHSMFSRCVYSEFSDYIVTSLRKWFAVPTGGWVGKINDILEVKPNIKSNHAVIEKIRGMNMKYYYIKEQDIDKEEFLQINSKFDNDLIHVDRMLELDDVSYDIMSGLDIDSIITRRKTNAKILERELSKLDNIMLPKMNLDVVAPLFYPIFLEKKDRDELRKYLGGVGIYCPIHWPEVMGANEGIRANELSLVCDQRYTEKDMYAMCKCIHEWYKNR